MNQYDIVFESLEELIAQDGALVNTDADPTELGAIEELRRFSAELKEPEPVSLTVSA